MLRYLDNISNRIHRCKQLDKRWIPCRERMFDCCLNVFTHFWIRREIPGLDQISTQMNQVDVLHFREWMSSAVMIVSIASCLRGWNRCRRRWKTFSQRSETRCLRKIIIQCLGIVGQKECRRVSRRNFTAGRRTRTRCSIATDIHRHLLRDLNRRRRRRRSRRWRRWS